MDQVFQAVNLGEIRLQIFRWLREDILAGNFWVQITCVLVALAIAWLAYGKFKGRIADWVHAKTDEDDPWLRRLGITVDALMLPAIWVGLLWAATFVLDGIGQPARFIALVATLLAIWIGIHLVSSVIRNGFWRKTFATLAWGAAALHFLHLLQPSIDFLDSMKFSAGKSDISIYKLMKAILLGFALLWAAFFLSAFLKGRLAVVDGLTPSMRALIYKLMRIVLVVSAVLIAMNAVGIDLTALAVFSGALGIGIGFGLQKVVSNFISGIIVLLDRSIRPNDVIEIGGTYGTVKTLGARYTSVITRDGTEYLIPNETLITEQVVNWSYSDSNVRRKVPIGIAYGSDMEKARELVLEACAATERIMTRPEPKCHLTGFGDNSVDLEARFWIADPHNGVNNVRSDFLRLVYKKFQDNDIEIPFPQRDLNIREGATIRVEVDQQQKSKEIN